MNKAEFKEKRKKLLEQRVRPTEGTEAVSAWDYDFNDSNEVLQSGEVELLENMTSIVPEDRPKTGEIFKEKRNKTRHKLDAPILSEQLSDYPGSLNARDAVPPMVLMMDDVPEDVQKSTLSDPVSLPTPELAVKKVSKDQSLVDLTREVKKHVHIISYGNTLYSELSGEISVDVNSYEFGEMPESTKEYYLSYGSDFKTAWLNAMYTDVYEYSGKYSNLDALSRFIEYLKFYDEATDYMEVEGMIQDLHEIWYDFDIETLTEEDAGVYVDRVIQMAEANGAEIQIW